MPVSPAGVSIPSPALERIPEVLCWILKLFLGDSADVSYTVDDNHHIRIDIQFHDDKTLLPETGEKEGKVKKKDGE